MHERLITESFSAGYELVHSADVFTHKGEAVMDGEMLSALRQRFSAPVVGRVGDAHYQFKPRNSIPGMAVAVPETTHANPDSLLIQK
jgi:hypothetical protein